MSLPQLNFSTPTSSVTPASGVAASPRDASNRFSRTLARCSAQIFAAFWVFQFVDIYVFETYDGRAPGLGFAAWNAAVFALAPAIGGGVVLGLLSVVAARWGDRARAVVAPYPPLVRLARWAKLLPRDGVVSLPAARQKMVLTIVGTFTVVAFLLLALVAELQR